MPGSSSITRICFATVTPTKGHVASPNYNPLRWIGWFDGTRAGAERIRAWEGATTVASGLRVPSPFADELVLRAIRETNGTAITVEEGEMLDAMRQLAEGVGCYACPEGGASLAALEKLRASGFIAAGERVVVFNTGSGLKYPEAWRMARERSPKAVRA